MRTNVFTVIVILSIPIKSLEAHWFRTNHFDVFLSRDRTLIICLSVAILNVMSWELLHNNSHKITVSGNWLISHKPFRRIFFWAETGPSLFVCGVGDCYFNTDLHLMLWLNFPEKPLLPQIILTGFLNSKKPVELSKISRNVSR